MQLFTEDIVERKDGSGMGIVARSWQEQPEADIPAEIADDPLLRPLLKGEVGVQSYPSGHREILPESSFNLLDRTTFVRGDFCKRAYDDIQSGVVLNLKIQVKVQHAITMEPVDLWFDKDEFVANQPLMLGDFVFYNDWVGQVEEIFSEALMHQSDSKVQPVYGLGGRFAIGEKCYAVTEASSTIPPMLDETSDVIIKVMPIAAAISWSAINQRLDSTTGHGLKRPPQLWASQDLQQLVVMRSRGSVAGSIGERVVFKDPARIASLGIHPVLYKDHELNFEVPVDVMVIRLTRTSVEVLWQDGTREWVPATELIPHINPDEHECWPGDFVLWKGEDEKRIAIVQSVAAKERIATVRWYDSDALEQVSVLDLDPHGPPLGEGGNLDAFGLRRGEFVLLHDSFTGSKVPMVPRIGELEPWVHDQPSRTPEGTLEGWRGELTSMALKSFGLEYMQHDRPSQIRLTADTVFGQLSGNETNRILPRSDILRTSSSDVIDWFGQVVDLTDSGEVVVSLPSSRLVQVPIHRCSLYRDIEDYQWDAESVANDDLGALYENDDQMSLGSWELEDAEERDDWGHMDTDSLGHSHHASSNPGQFKAFAQAQAVMPGSFDPRPPTPLSDDDDQITRVSSSPSEGKLKNSASKLSSSIEEVAMLLDDAQSHSGTSGNDVSEEDLQTNWKRFEILSEAPADHAFFSVDPPQLSKQFLSRIAKEYRVLESTLPDTILVRAYEDRADLLRSLIIGPQNTPYQDAPFVIDWRLDGSFPQTPPIAHFLSWTNGNGRVNPNLYEEGKVCLSILGTWAGDRSESWSAARSSILQALVSIQGLVLVKEPYFCEPGFEKMRGTEEGRINSHLYSEKAYVLSRGFVRRALEIPLGGLEQEISWFYIKNGMLKKVLADAEQLISRSSSKVDQDDSSAISGLSAGGILALNRTLTKLRSLLHNLTAIQA